MNKINPFTPQSPVPTGLFVGRVDSIRKINSAFLQTRAQNPTNVLLTGERGIGKTSLLRLCRLQAEGRIECKGHELNFLTIEVDISPNTDQLTLIERIKNGLKRQLGKTEKTKKIVSESLNFLKKFEAAGISYTEEKNTNEEIIAEDFAHYLASTSNRISRKTDRNDKEEERKDGIIIFIDEADSASSELALGRFLKSLSERIQRNECNNIMFVVCGLNDVKEKLIESHPSSLRIFDDIKLDRLTGIEIKSVLDMCLRKSKNEYQYPIEIDEEATQILVGLSEGYPHFVQQFGYSAFEADTNGIIETDDAMDGAFGRFGALESIGERYYRNDFYNRIQKESYRQVLRIMADRLDSWVTKEDIQKDFNGKESTLNNAIKALRDRRIIISKEGTRGIYRLQHKGFALWISLYTKEAAQMQLPSMTEENPEECTSS